MAFDLSLKRGSKCVGEKQIHSTFSGVFDPEKKIYLIFEVTGIKDFVKGCESQ